MQFDVPLIMDAKPGKNLSVRKRNDLLNQLRKSVRTGLAVLVDPDKQNPESLKKLVKASVAHGVEFFLVGGSLLMSDGLEDGIRILKKSGIPVILFPGNAWQISEQADGLLFLSLLSGRNPEFLIGQQVLAAPRVKASGLEVIPTGYLLVNGGSVSATAYLTQTLPLPEDKPELSIATAWAAEMMGMQVLYLEGGSGAERGISAELVKAVCRQVKLPVICGGGVKTAAQAVALQKAGARLIVLGNVLEEDLSKLKEIANALKGQTT